MAERAKQKTPGDDSVSVVLDVTFHRDDLAAHILSGLTGLVLPLGIPSVVVLSNVPEDLCESVLCAADRAMTYVHGRLLAAQTDYMRVTPIEEIEIGTIN